MQIIQVTGIEGTDGLTVGQLTLEKLSAADATGDSGPPQTPCRVRSLQPFFLRHVR